MIAGAGQSTDYQLTACHDRQIQAELAAALAGSKYGPLRSLQCRVRDGVVEISGKVPSFYLKQLAQAAILQMISAGEVRNLVEVSESSLLVAKHCGGPQDAPRGGPQSIPCGGPQSTPRGGPQSKTAC